MERRKSVHTLVLGGVAQILLRLRLSASQIANPRKAFYQDRNADSRKTMRRVELSEIRSCRNLQCFGVPHSNSVYLHRYARDRSRGQLSGDILRVVFHLNPLQICCCREGRNHAHCNRRRSPHPSHGCVRTSSVSAEDCAADCRCNGNGWCFRDYEGQSALGKCSVPNGWHRLLCSYSGSSTAPLPNPWSVDSSEPSFDLGCARSRPRSSRRIPRRLAV